MHILSSFPAAWEKQSLYSM